MRRKRSSNEQFRVRIPADVLDAARGQSLVLTVGNTSLLKSIGPKAVEIGLSLRTSDPSEVKLRQSDVLRQVETFFAGLRQRQSPTSLTHEQCVRLAGDFYRAWTSGGPDEGLRELEPDALARSWHKVEKRLGEALESGAEQAIAGLRKLAGRFLLGRGLTVDEPALETFCDEIVKAVRDAAKTNARKAAGDYSEDLLARRFGEPWCPGEKQTQQVKWSERSSSSAKTRGAVGLSLRELVAKWRDDPQNAPSASTVASYAKAFDRLATFVGHDDPTRLTTEDVERFKRHRLDVDKVKPKTFKDSDLAALRSVLGWAIENKLLSAPNAAIGIKVRVPRRTLSRTEKGFSDAEAKAILRHALEYNRGRTEKAKTAAAKRWVPWLMAYSGARVGEVAQLRKQDVLRHEAGFWFMRLVPEAGTIKTNEPRDVPLHSHLIEQGFIQDLVENAPDGHLFLDPKGSEPTCSKPTLRRKPMRSHVQAGTVGISSKAASRTDDPRGILGPLQGLKNRLQEFVREIVRDPEVQPQHGWRHRVKAVAFSVGVQERVIDEIQGHAPRHEGGRYGTVALETKQAAIERLPRYTV